MAGRTSASSKMEIAKTTLLRLLAELPPDTQVAVRAYGHRSKTGCGDVELLAPLNHAATAACIMAERALSRALSGSCNLPLAAFAETIDKNIRLRACVGMPDGTLLISGERSGPVAEPEVLGAALAEELKSRGAGAILARLERQAAADERR